MLSRLLVAAYEDFGQLTFVVRLDFCKIDQLKLFLGPFFRIAFIFNGASRII